MSTSSISARTNWKWAFGLLCLACLAVVAAGVMWKIASGAATAAAPARPAAPAISVVAAHARTGDKGVYLTGLGTVTALTTVTVRTRVDGEIVTVAFREGQLVQRGDLLVQIDPRPFQVMVEQAEGQYARDAATLENARVDLKRYQALVAEEGVPRQTLDTQVSLVQQLEAGLKSDRAAIDTARLNLVFARITSPITGRIGLRLVDTGNVVHATDTTGLAVITQRQPIAVVFTIPQDSLPDVQKPIAAGRVPTVDAYDRSFATKLASGTLSAIDSQIDPTTGTIKLKATFANEHDRLFPNQFVNARVLVDTIEHAIIVPAAAIQRGPQGPQQTFVYVINAKQAVEARDVIVSLTDNGETVVSRGLATGELVVIDGVERLQPGLTVAARVADADADTSTRRSEP
jgi:membrane fusion protein, multidrug efflux system